MVLHSFRVKEFRSVQDSGWIDAEQITALIGTNESGKTNILLPLWKLNPADEGKIDLKDDLPRDKYHLYRDAKEKPVFISARYVLSKDEIMELAEISGHSSDEFSEVVVSKDFDNQLFWEFPNEKSDASHLITSARNVLSECRQTIEASKSAVSKSEDERKKKALSILEIACKEIENHDDVSVALKAVQNKLEEFNEDVKTSVVCASVLDATQKIRLLICESTKPTLSNDGQVTDFLKMKMPKYVYYSNYGNLDSQIYLPQVLGNIDKQNLGVKEAAKARTLKTLFKFVDLNPKEITDLGAESTGNLTPAQITAISDKKKSIFPATASYGSWQHYLHSRSCSLQTAGQPGKAD